MSQTSRAPISAGLIARKGAAMTSSALEAPSVPVPQPAANDAPPARTERPAKTEPDVPLNFNVPASFKKRFAMAALNEDRNHKQFLLWLFEQYEAGKARSD